MIELINWSFLNLKVGKLQEEKVARPFRFQLFPVLKVMHFVKVNKSPLTFSSAKKKLFSTEKNKKFYFGYEEVCTYDTIVIENILW